MLTHADAASDFREAAIRRLGEITAVIPGTDAGLRASLLHAIINGVIVDRYLLKLGRLAEASPDDVIDLLRPCFQSLTGRAAT
jgi:hypothetical protein